MDNLFETLLRRARTALDLGLSIEDLRLQFLKEDPSLPEEMIFFVFCGAKILSKE